jgi:hypothetical protein
MVWGVGLPLLLIGGAWRALRRRLPAWESAFNQAPIAAAMAGLVVVAFAARMSGMNLWAALSFGAAVCGLSGFVLWCGWQLAEGRGPGERDAHFGKTEDFRTAGMSDER